MIGVRPLEATDLPAVLELARSMHDEAPHYRDFPFVDERFHQWAELFLSNPDWLCVLAIDENTGPVGMFALGAVPMIFGNEISVDDLVFYVHPAWRGTTAAIRMMRYLEAWAAGKGARQIRIGITTGINLEQTKRFLERFGFVQTGVLMTRSC